MWAGHCAQEVEVGWAEGSDHPVGAATEDEAVGDGEAGGLGGLETHTHTQKHASQAGEDGWYQLVYEDTGR